MEFAFWDSSSIVPVCVRQRASPRAKELTINYGMVVSWFAPVEIRGSFARLIRMNQITPNDQVQALVFLDDLADVDDANAASLQLRRTRRGLRILLWLIVSSRLLLTVSGRLLAIGLWTLAVLLLLRPGGGTQPEHGSQTRHLRRSCVRSKHML